jgi:hypothetical protein
MNERNDVRQDGSSSPPEKSCPPGEHQPIEADALALSAQGEESNADREPDLAAGKQAKVRVEYKHSLATRRLPAGSVSSGRFKLSKDEYGGSIEIVRD